MLNYSLWHLYIISPIEIGILVILVVQNFEKSYLHFSLLSSHWKEYLPFKICKKNMTSYRYFIMLPLLLPLGRKTQKYEEKKMKEKRAKKRIIKWTMPVDCVNKSLQEVTVFWKSWSYLVCTFLSRKASFLKYSSCCYMFEVQVVNFKKNDDDRPSI